MLEREAESEGGDERRALGTMAATFSLSLSLSRLLIRRRFRDV
jgi:hypothetical protein